MDPREGRDFIRRVASTYSTPLNTVSEMEWLEIIDHHLAALYDDYLEKRFQMQVAGLKLR